MKTKHTIIVSCVLVAAIILSGLALADSQAKGSRQGFGHKHRYKGDGLMLLAKYQQKNLMVHALSDMTGQSVEAIGTKLKEQHMRAVMQELGIDREAFRTAIRIKAIDLIQKSAESGTITPEQAKDIIAKMENRSKRYELMSRLIEKGIEDGTITPEQAQMLMHKPR
jgi:polyhydroxyalkanoate synthesis regulator phasin